MPDHSQFDTDPHLSGPDDHLQQPANQHVCCHSDRRTNDRPSKTPQRTCGCHLPTAESPSKSLTRYTQANVDQ
jgi:hypothetical protein